MLHHPVINYLRVALGWPPVFVWDAGVISDASKERFKQLCLTYDVDVVSAGHTHENRVYNASMDEGSSHCDKGGYDRAYESSECPEVSFPLSSSLEGTLYQYTGAAKERYYRKIHVYADDVVVDKQSLSRDVITAYGGGVGSWKNRDDSTICPMTLHLFDSVGNHVGRNDTSGLDFQIDGAVYSLMPLTPILDPDSILLVNTIEEISTFTDSGDFRYEIHGVTNGVAFIGLRRGLIDGSQVTAFYDSVTITDNSIGKLYVNNDSVDYTIYMDDDGDGTIDREIEPDILYPQTYICGDVDGNGSNANIGDLTYLVDYLFFDGPPPPVLEAANVDGQGGINVADLTYLVDYLFFGGPEPICGPIE